MATTAQAMVWHGKDRFVRTEMPIPQLNEGESLVRITAATICQSDRHTVAGRRSSPEPSVLGHEGVGVIVQTNGGVDVDGNPLREGDRVVWSVVSACGQCDRCQRGLSSKCRVLKKTGHELFDDIWPLSGTYSTHMVIRARQAVVTISETVPDAVASTAACAGATVMAAFDAAGCSPDSAAGLVGKRVLVNGVGMLGIYAVGVAKQLGATHVEARDVNGERLQLAAEWGAHKAVHSGEEPVCPVDVAMEFSGHPSGVRTAVDSLRIGGTAVLVGSVAPSDPVALDPEWLVRGWRTVTGVHNFEPRHLAQAVEFLEQCASELTWDGIVGEPIGLEEVPSAFREGGDGHAVGATRDGQQPMRVVVAPGQ